MCIIIVKEKGKIVPNQAIKKSASINRDGLGIVWLDDYSITYHKSKEYKVLETDRPYIAHFRYATVGKVGIENTHPFKCASTDEYLMMNGTISGLGNKTTCDSKVLAEMIGWMPRNQWKEQLGMFGSRFVCANVKKKTFEIFNQELWTQHDGVWYSKDNVLEPNYVAVYGTLKKGNSNYHHYLSDSTFIGSGVTTDKYPLVVPQSLPYLLDEKGKGHNVEVDVFSVSNEVLKDLDRLEGHPNFYTRKQISISVGKSKIKCWIYFNTKIKSTPVDELLKTFKQKPYQSTFGYGKAISTPKTTYVNPTWEGKYDSIKDEAPLCPTCYDYVTYDMLGSHYCKRCDGWYDERELLTL